MNAILCALLLVSATTINGDDPDAKPPVTSEDVRIVQRASEILDSPAKWNRSDTRVCPPTATTFSIYCALERATREISGQFAHRGAAMQEARFVIDDIAPNVEKYEHRLMDYNNDPTTTFADLQKFFTLLEARIQKQITLQSAFRELDQMCARDHGRMWGVSLCGPAMFVDPKTREVIANETAHASTLPQSIGVANTSVEWGGKRWTMIMLPLPESEYDRRVLLVHESFHRIQPKLGLPIGQEGGNAHLDALEGRYWLQLEWRALAAALRGDRAALNDALAFRAKRRSLFPKAAEEERALEFREGLAEYTGTAFTEPSVKKRVPHLIEALRDAEKKPSFVRSFAYASGPAWGAILEMRNRNWTRHVHATDDLAELAWGGPGLKSGFSRPAEAGAHTATSGTAKGRPESVEERALQYDGAELLAAEKARDEKRQAMLREFRARFIDGPVLVLPLRKFSFEMNPNEATPFESYGTVFPKLTLRDEWGTIVVRRGGALIGSEWNRLTVPRPPSDDYTLTLSERWQIEGDTVIKKAEGGRMKDE